MANRFRSPRPSLAVALVAVLAMQLWALALLTTSAAGASSETPLRINISTVDLTMAGKFCSSAGMSVNGVSCSEAHVLTNEKRETITDFILPLAMNAHQMRLKVKRNVGNVTVSSCGPATIPESHKTAGIDTDFILYVLAPPTANSAMATATFCSTGSNKRPTAGYIYIDPASVDSPYMVNTVTREIAHALGFSLKQFKEFGMITATANVRGHDVTLLTSPEVKKKAIEHYGCPDLNGMEMTSDGMYWKKRNALYELMSPTVESRTIAYSVLTLAAFADTGVYTVDYSQADVLKWGENAGCNFTNTSCVVDGVSQYPEFFCTVPREARCTGDYRAYGGCVMNLGAEGLPSYFQYWKYPLVGGVDAEMEYCPYVQRYEFGDCAGSLFPIDEFVYGDSSRCMNGFNITYNITSNTTNADTQKHRQSLCVEVEFINANGKGELKFRPKGGEWVSCPAGGAAGRVSIAGNGIFTSGYLECPEYDQIYSQYVPTGLNARAKGGKEVAPWVWGVVAVVCVIIVAIVVGVVLYCCCCKKKEQEAATLKEEQLHAADGNISMLTTRSLPDSLAATPHNRSMNGSFASHDKRDEVISFTGSHCKRDEVISFTGSNHQRNDVVSFVESRQGKMSLMGSRQDKMSLMDSRQDKMSFMDSHQDKMSLMDSHQDKMSLMESRDGLDDVSSIQNPLKKRGRN